MNKNTTAFGLSDAVRALSRHRKKALLTFFLTMVVMVVAMVLIPKTYHSQGMLLFRLGKENATLDPTVTLGQDVVVTVPPSREEELNSIVEICKSRAVAEKAVDALGPDFVLGNSPAASDADEPAGFAARCGQWLHGAVSEAKSLVHTLQGRPAASPREAAIEKLITACGVSTTRHTNLISVDCKGPSPEWAQKVVAQLMDSYQTEHCRINRPDHCVEFFAEQSQRALRDLTAKQESLRDVKTAGGVVARVEQRQAFTAQVTRMEDELQQAHAARSVSESRIAALDSELASLPAEQIESSTTGIGNEGTDMMRSQLYSLEIKKEEAAAKYTGAHPSMKALHDELEASRHVAKSEEGTRTHVVKAQSRLYLDTKSSLLQEQAQLAASRTRENVLGTQLAALRSQMKDINEQDLQIAALERDIDVCQAAYHRYASGYEQAKIDQARATQQISNIAVAQPATYELEPIFPKNGSFLLGGALIAALAGLGVALLAEIRDRSFREPEDVERRLGVSVLATIPHFAGRQLSTSGQRRV